MMGLYQSIQGRSGYTRCVVCGCGVYKEGHKLVYRMCFVCVCCVYVCVGGGGGGGLVYSP